MLKCCIPILQCLIPILHCPIPILSCFYKQVLKFSSSGETWVERAPYHPPDVTVPVKPAEPEKKEVAPVKTEENMGGAEEGGVKPYIPPPPPLPPIMAPVPEEEPEQGGEEEEREEERDKVCVALSAVQVIECGCGYRRRRYQDDQ